MKLIPIMLDLQTMSAFLQFLDFFLEIADILSLFQIFVILFNDIEFLFDLVVDLGELLVKEMRLMQLVNSFAEFPFNSIEFA